MSEQPRDPKGTSTGGQWTSSAAGTARPTAKVVRASFPSPEGGFHDPTRDPAPLADPDFVYHATSEERAREMASGGELIPHRPNYGTEQDAWPDGSTSKRSYFIGDPAHAGSFAPEEGKPVLLRVPAEGMKRESTGDRFTNKPIPVHKVEIFGRDGSWYRLGKVGA
jgi:hypothetical protein